MLFSPNECPCLCRHNYIDIEQVYHLIKHEPPIVKDHDIFSFFKYYFFWILEHSVPSLYFQFCPLFFIPCTLAPSIPLWLVKEMNADPQGTLESHDSTYTKKVNILVSKQPNKCCRLFLSSCPCNVMTNVTVVEV